MIAHVSLGGRCEQWLSQLLALLHPLRQLNPTNSPCLLVLLPPRPRDVATNNGLDLENPQPLDQHAPPLNASLVHPHLLWHLPNISCDQVVAQHILQLLKPEQAQLGQDLALAWHSLPKR